MSTSSREPRSEQIQLDYVVEFEDGLRPRLHVYGINPETQEIYGADACIGIIVGAGYSIKSNEKVAFSTNLGTSLTIQKFKAESPEDKGWEQKVHELSREQGINVIRVQNLEHVEPAIDRHTELYAKQFGELAETFSILFSEFVGKQHPSYIKYV